MAGLAYRLRIYQERALQSNLTTEPDILAPAGGAAHSDNFQVATITGVSGYQPYLDLPDGRTSKLDRLTRKTDQGQMTFTLTDKELTAGSNLTRWVTAFLSELKPGCKVQCDESDDDGSTWTVWWTGRVEGLRLDGRTAIAIRCRDMLGDLARHTAFVGRPEASITYAAEPLLLPIGLSAAFGSQPAVRLLSGTMNTDGVFRTITLDSGSFGRKENVVTSALIRAARIPLGKVNVPIEVRASENLRVRFTTGAITQKEAVLTKIEVKRRGKHFSVSKLWCKATDTDDVYYTAMDTGTIANAASLTNVSVRLAALAEAGGETPLLLDGVRGPQLIADLLDGKFGRLEADGTVGRTFPYDSAGTFATLIADDSFPLLRFVIPGPAKLKEWVEQHVLRQSGLGWRLNASGELVLLDLRPPTASPTSTTITEADLADGTLPDWEEHRDQAVNVVRVTTFLDVDRDADNLGDAYVPQVPTTLLDSYPVAEPDVVVGDNYDLGYLPLDIPCEGFRTFANETLDNQERAQVLTAQALNLAQQFRPFGAALIYLTLACARTSNTDVQVGQFRLIDVDCLPDPGTNLRGGTRLMLCVERTDQPRQGRVRRLRFVDYGLNAVATAPTVGTPAQEASNTQHGITAAVTLNASSELAVVYIITTATSVGTRPADDDAGWRMIQPAGQVDVYVHATGTVTIRPVAAGKRHWVAVQTIPQLGTKLASVRAYPSGTGYVDSAALTAPNTAAVASVSTKAALLTWSNNSDDVSGVEIWLASGASEAAAEAATPVVFRRLPPGTTGFQLTGLDTTLPDLGTAGPWYYPQVKHVDGYGGVSTAAEIAGVSFEATGAAGTAPDMAAVLVTRDNSNSPYPGGSTGGAIPLGETGIELKLVVAPTGLGLDIELERAPDSGGSPGTYAQIAKIPQVASVAQLYRDALPRNGLTYWYRARESGDGVSAGGYSAAVSASPGWLPIVASGVDLPGRSVLGQPVTVTLTAEDFKTATDAEPYQRLNGYIRPRTAGTGITVTAGVRLPVGAIITGFECRGMKVDAGDTMQPILYEVDTDGSSTTLASLTFSNSGSYQTQTDTTLTDPVQAGYRYVVSVQLNGVGTATDAILLWAKVTYVPNDDRQMVN